MARTPRKPTVSPQSGEGRQIGLDDREIPGGLPHLGNAETHSEKAKVPVSETIPSINEHRVYDPKRAEKYDNPEGGKVVIPKPAALPDERYAVPVYNVEHPGKTRMHLMALADNILVPVPSATADPIAICGKDYGRLEVLLLNEDPANDVRVSEERSFLLEGRGAIIKHGATGYTKIRTQDTLYAAASTAACLMSVILVTDVND